MMLDGGGVAGRWRGRVLAGRAGGAHAWEEARKCTVGGAEHDTVWKSRIYSCLVIFETCAHFL